jgi:hypothetical protein
VIISGVTFIIKVLPSSEYLFFQRSCQNRPIVIGHSHRTGFDLRLAITFLLDELTNLFDRLRGHVALIAADEVDLAAIDATLLIDHPRGCRGSPA